MIEAGVLRAFAKLRLGDAAGQDWYTHYLDVACMNSRNVAAMVRKTVEGDASSLEASLHEPLSGKMRDVRATLLSVSPRQPIARSEETDARDARRQQPSRRQVDDAIRVMSARLERLFTGEVYRSASGSPIERSVAFHIDAGILYCMLARTFRYPDDAWTKILAESLGPYRGAVESRHELLESMREYHALWEANEHDGPLQALIDAAGGGNDVGGEPAPGMMLDASYLVGQVREIVERSDDPAAERRR